MPCKMLSNNSPPVTNKMLSCCAEIVASSLFIHPGYGNLKNNCFSTNNLKEKQSTVG